MEQRAPYINNQREDGRVLGARIAKSWAGLMVHWNSDRLIMSAENMLLRRLQRLPELSRRPQLVTNVCHEGEV